MTEQKRKRELIGATTVRDGKISIDFTEPGNMFYGAPPDGKFTMSVEKNEDGLIVALVINFDEPTQ